MGIQRGVVHGRIDDFKTEYSRDFVPLATQLAAELLGYREQAYPTEVGGLFAYPKNEKTLPSGGNPNEASPESGEGRENSGDDWVEDIPPQLPLMAKPDRRPGWGSERTDAACQHYYHHEPLPQGDVG